jgi:hypothetical protein
MTAIASQGVGRQVFQLKGADFDIRTEIQIRPTTGSDGEGQL